MRSVTVLKCPSVRPSSQSKTDGGMAKFPVFGVADWARAPHHAFFQSEFPGLRAINELSHSRFLLGHSN